jgi:hypothetical protein
MRIRLIPCLALVALAVQPAGASAAPIVDQVQVAVPGQAATRGFSGNLGVILVSPDQYERGCCYDSRRGQWQGPEWHASSGFAAPSHIDWSLSSVRTGRSVKTLAAAGGRHGYPAVSQGALKVRHVVDGRTVGTLKAYQVLDAAPSPSAEAEETLVVDLGGRVKSILSIEASDPAVDSDPGLGSFTVNGMAASAWNRRQALATARNAYLEGNLPPRRVRAKAKGGRVTGKVVDRFGHPVADTPVVLLRGAKRVAKGTTSPRGTFSLQGAAGGTYRVLASLAGTKARSGKLRLR